MNTVYVMHMRVLNGSSALQRFESSNAVEIHNRRMFDFYPGLAQLWFSTIVGFAYCETLESAVTIPETLLSKIGGHLGMQ